jgi:hypothetical protein
VEYYGLPAELASRPSPDMGRATICVDESRD